MSRWILIPETLRFSQHLVHTFLYGPGLKGHWGRSERRCGRCDGEMWCCTAERGAEQHLRGDARVSPSLSHTHKTRHALIHRRWVSQCAAGEEALLPCHRQPVWDDALLRPTLFYSVFTPLSVWKSIVNWSVSACLPTVLWQLMKRQSIHKLLAVSTLSTNTTPHISVCSDLKKKKKKWKEGLSHANMERKTTGCLQPAQVESWTPGQ